jgi:hypothetical protein
MKHFKPIIILLALVVGMISCKKDDDKSNTDMLTGKYWIFTSLTISPAVMIGGTPLTDWWSQVPACQKDNLMKFDTPNVFTDDEGASKCDPNDPQTITGTWAFNADETVISITEDGQTTSFNVIDLSDSDIKMTNSQVMDLGSGPISYTMTYTAKKK